MLFDTHAHPYITFKKSPEQILEHFFREKNNKLISIGCDEETSKKSVELAQQYPGIKAAIGFHPCDIPYTSFSQDSYYEKIQNKMDYFRELYINHKSFIVAIGEIGLDYFHLSSLSDTSGLNQEEIKNIQNIFFRAQIQLAHELHLPFIIHSRDSNEQVLEILYQENAKNYVFHCFSGDWNFAQRVLSQNPKAKFGIGGVVTFKKSHALQEVVKNLPLENIFLETDCPFLTPEPLRGKEENEPIFTNFVLKKIQDLRDENPDFIEKMLFENAEKFFS